jgi:putative ABC transport system permease protein
VVVNAGAYTRALVAAIRDASARVDSTVPLHRVQTLGQVRASRLADRRFAMTGTLTFGVLAAGLSLLGFYGVLACLVQQRTREIGIRLAMGATASRLRWWVLSNGAAHAIAGILVGGACALGFWRLVATRMPGLGLMDVRIVGLPAGALLVVALAATWIPARRATQVNPVDALRAE